ncbi:SIR2 family protein [Streptococcus uberis]|uniref:SIR2 family protein n=1 Tax=Streptococcus uberis TaxID=1349 RepID=UPI001939C003|nr:SIR2 family protein [Streptococcus uberis]
MNEDILILQKLAITKQLNFLIGSGASVPAIPLMGTFSDTPEKKAVEQLKEKIYKVSSDLILNNLNENTTKTLDSYQHFIECLISLMNKSNSRQTPRNINIFTTNYDLFIEKSIDNIIQNTRLIFNDGASGYFNRILDSSNYNRVVSYKGINDNYIDEIPSISLLKPHGSVNWSKINENIIVHSNLAEMTEMIFVEPNGLEGQNTFLNNHFHEILRSFQIELDKPQSILIVTGFSFQDQHIAKMVKRALQNSELLIYIFAYSDNDKKIILNNLSLSGERTNLKIITPEESGNIPITLNRLTYFLSGKYAEEEKINESKTT